MKHNQILRPSISVFDEDIEERLLCPQKSFYKFEFIDKLTKNIPLPFVESPVYFLAEDEYFLIHLKSRHHIRDSIRKFFRAWTNNFLTTTHHTFRYFPYNQNWNKILFSRAKINSAQYAKPGDLVTWAEHFCQVKWRLNYPLSWLIVHWWLDLKYISLIKPLTGGDSAGVNVKYLDFLIKYILSFWTMAASKYEGIPENP